MAERQAFLLENSPRESWKEIIIFLLFCAHLCLYSQARSSSPRALLVWSRHRDQVQRLSVISMGKVPAGAGQLSPVFLLLFLAPLPNLSALGHLPAAYPNNSQLLPTVQTLPSYLTIAKISSRSLSLSLVNQHPQLSTIFPNHSSHLLITILPVQKPSWPLHTHHSTYSVVFISAHPHSPCPRPSPAIPPDPEQANISLQKARQ